MRATLDKISHWASEKLWRRTDSVRLTVLGSDRAQGYSSVPLTRTILLKVARSHMTRSVSRRHVMHEHVDTLVNGAMTNNEAIKQVGFPSLE